METANSWGLGRRQCPGHKSHTALPPGTVRIPEKPVPKAQPGDFKALVRARCVSPGAAGHADGWAAGPREAEVPTQATPEHPAGLQWEPSGGRPLCRGSAFHAELSSFPCKEEGGCNSPLLRFKFCVFVFGTSWVTAAGSYFPDVG